MIFIERNRPNLKTKVEFQIVRVARAFLFSQDMSFLRDAPSLSVLTRRDCETLIEASLLSLNLEDDLTENSIRHGDDKLSHFAKLEEVHNHENLHFFLASILKDFISLSPNCDSRISAVLRSDSEFSSEHRVALLAYYLARQLFTEAQVRSILFLC